MIEDTTILKRLTRIKEIPTLPEVIQEVLAAVASDESSARDLAGIISKDQSLCSKALRIANSAFFAQNRRILEIEDAIVVLGFDSIAQLIVATVVVDAFRSVRLSPSFKLYGVWKHSIGVAVTSRIIAETVLGEAKPSTAYTAGLLHDAGKLVMLSYLPDRYAPVLAKLESAELFVHEAERSILGFTHCDVSEWLCRRWNFPKELIGPIARHHHDLPSDPDGDVVTRIVRLANILCNRMEIGYSGNAKKYSVSSEELVTIGLDEVKTGKIEESLIERDKEIDLLLTSIS